MESFEELIHLDAESKLYATENHEDVYRVVSGTVMVSIAPLKNGRPVSRLFLREAEAGDLIPSFSFRDTEYRQWRFFLSAKEEAELICMKQKATKVLQRNFVRVAGIRNYEQEGYDLCLVEHYNREIVKATAIILSDEKGRLVEKEKAGEAIVGTFDPDRERIIGENTLYRAMAVACRSAKIPIVDAAKLATVCKEDENITVQNIAEISGFAYRSIILDEKWYRKDNGVIIGKINDRFISCIPKGQTSYEIYYGDTNVREKLTSAVAETVDPHAFCICRVLPPHSLSKKDLLKYALSSVRSADLIVVSLLTLLGALIGILIPTLNQKIYDDYVPLGDYNQLIQLCIVIATFMLTSLFFDIVKNLSQDRISSRVGYDLQNAVYYRVFRLPESFMRKFESADMAQRLSFVRSYVDSYADTILISGIGALFSLLYLYKMFSYAKQLAWIAIVMLIIYTVVVTFAATRTMKFQTIIGEKQGESSSRLYQYLSGVDKIRLAGAEERAVNNYLLPFTDIESARIRMNRHTSFMAVMQGIASTLFSMVFYYIIVKKNVSLTTGNFTAFNSAFGSFSAAFLQLTSGILGIYQMKPLYERFAPIVETAEEDDENSEIPGELSGEISLKNVRFSYVENGPVILNGIDLTIAPGEYLGIVGSSGCGKSTLLKLLLGFETPTQGSVHYGDKDLKSLDKRRLRKNLGVVLQSGQLISGSIYENITITSPSATSAQVNAVVEAVGLKHDIEQMPMGLQTVLSESSGTISGGQKQRILIARAIINNPAILIFDEATSALDNLTQAAVSESLDKMNSTRIVVAHRLSTIKNCDRIIVLDGGKIVEEGNYSTLMSLGGLFYRLASRQMVD